MSEPPVLYEQDDHVVTISYNRPEALNAVNGELREHLNAAWLRFRDDKDAWVAILTGSGDRAFSAGADMKNGEGSAGTWDGTFFEIPTINSFESGLELFKPTVAAVKGYCLGYGLTAVSACDFVVAGESAEFGFPEVLLGVPTIVGSIRLPGKIGWANAMEMLLTGDRFSAAEAKEMGLVWKVVPDDEVDAEAHKMAARLCQGAPLALRATKEVGWRSQRMGWTESVRFGETIRRQVGISEDAAEGRRAIREGRTPEWKGQ
ncbi:MAG: enoyl-CoA hydratase/isomerase family protein [Actinomycetia bacterium]|nr:enoyl-CoA hydratase/isomerase family protein [Actinomycetes bacterium]